MLNVATSERDPREHREEGREQVEELLVDVAGVLVGELRSRDGLVAGGQHPLHPVQELVLGHARLCLHRDAPHLIGPMEQVLLGALEGEGGEGDPAQPLGGAERRDADDLHGDGVRRLQRCRVADPKAAVVGRAAVDDDLVVGAGYPSFDEPIGIEVAVLDPVAGQRRWTVPAELVAVLPDELTEALHGRGGGGYTVDAAHPVDDRRVDEPALAVGFAGIGAELRGVADHDVGSRVRLGEQVVEVPSQRVAEHERAGRGTQRR